MKRSIKIAVLKHLCLVWFLRIKTVSKTHPSLIFTFDVIKRKIWFSPMTRSGPRFAEESPFTSVPPYQLLPRSGHFPIRLRRSHGFPYYTTWHAMPSRFHQVNFCRLLKSVKGVDGLDFKQISQSSCLVLLFCRTEVFLRKATHSEFEVLLFWHKNLICFKILR